MASGAPGIGRAGLRVSSWKGGRRRCGGVFDLCDGRGCGPQCGASCWMSICSGSRAAGLSSVAGAFRGLVGGWSSGQSLLLAECRSPQFEHLAGQARQQLSMALRLPQEGHEGLGERCSAFVCWTDQRGHVGASALQSGLTWPYFQHFWHWVRGEDEYAFSTVRELP